MKKIWTRIWLSAATVVVAGLALSLIIALHLAKAVQFIFLAVTGRNRAEHRA